MSVSRVSAGLVAAILISNPALLPAAPTPARKPVLRLTCTDFLGYEDAAKPVVVYWAAIHDRAGRLVIDSIDVDETDRIVPTVVEKCRTAPDNSLWQTVKAETGNSIRPASSRARPARDLTD